MVTEHVQYDFNAFKFIGTALAPDLVHLGECFMGTWGEKCSIKQNKKATKPSWLVRLFESLIQILTECLSPSIHYQQRTVEIPICNYGLAHLFSVVSVFGSCISFSILGREN